MVSFPHSLVPLAMYTPHKITKLLLKPNTMKILTKSFSSLILPHFQRVMCVPKLLKFHQNQISTHFGNKLVKYGKNMYDYTSTIKSRTSIINIEQDESEFACSK